MKNISHIFIFRPSFGLGRLVYGLFKPIQNKFYSNFFLSTTDFIAFVETPAGKTQLKAAMIKLKNHNVPATGDDHTMSVADFVASVSEIKVPPPAGRSMATSWWLQKWPPTPARQSRSASRKALAGACRVHLRVLRRTPCKEAGSRGGSHRTPGSALRSDPPLPQSSRGCGRRLASAANG